MATAQPIVKRKSVRSLFLCCFPRTGILWPWLFCCCLAGSGFFGRGCFSFSQHLFGRGFLRRCLFGDRLFGRDLLFTGRAVAALALGDRHIIDHVRIRPPGFGRALLRCCLLRRRQMLVVGNGVLFIPHRLFSKRLCRFFYRSHVSVLNLQLFWAMQQDATGDVRVPSRSFGYC